MRFLLQLAIVHVYSHVVDNDNRNAVQCDAWQHDVMSNFIETNFFFFLCLPLLVDEPSYSHYLSTGTSTSTF